MSKSGNKSRTVAIILAIFAGIFGAHRFYLGQIGLGILYVVLSATGISFILSIIDITLFVTNGERHFNKKYNSDNNTQDYNHNSRSDSHKRNTPRSEQMQAIEHKKYKQKGVEEFKQYDVEEAIKSFKQALSINENDISTHFNLACSYAICEEKVLAFAHLSKSVELGYDDYDKILQHDALAYLRIQDEWDAFRKNGFKLKHKHLEPSEESNLLDELQHLDQLKESGYLSLSEFREKKKEILGKSDSKN